MFNLFPKVTIDLGAIKRNYINMSRNIGETSICSAVLKNDAYGLGVKRVSQTLYDSGCRDFWVAYITEAIELRETLPTDSNIYFLQGFSSEYIPSIRRYNIVPVINSIDELYTIKEYDIEIVLHVDTGLNRLGIRPSDVDVICNSQNKFIFHVKYIISHLSCSDDAENPNNSMQKEEFDKSLSKFNKIFPEAKAGISSSFGVLINYHEYAYDMVRVGAYLYGIQTSFHKPENVLSMASIVLQRYSVPQGTKIGYGATYIADAEKMIAVISIGYADGIRRSLSNSGQIMFYDQNNKRYNARILGAISMDLLVCDVTNIPENITSPHMPAIILDNNYTINEMAKDAGTIPYEILTSINFKSQRIEKIYI